MASSGAKTVEQYLASLSADRREEIAAVRDVVNRHLPAGFVEGMQYGMLGWAVPLSRYPDTYNGQPLAIAGLASQKNYNSLYLMGVYGLPSVRKEFEAAYKKSGKKLDMGKSCLRFKRAEDLPLDVVGRAIAAVSVEDFIAAAEAARGGTRKKKAPVKKKGAAKKKVAAKKKAAVKKAGARKS